MMNRVINGFARLPDASLELVANNIVSKLTNNPSFTDPEPTLVQVKAGIEGYHVALIGAQSGSRAEVALKNTKKMELVKILQDLGSYVNYAAQGNVDALLTSGFTLARPAVPAPLVTKPSDVRLADGLNTGELEISLKKVPGAKGYQFECTPDPVVQGVAWQAVPSPVRKYVFTGLLSGKRYWCRVGAVGSHGQLVYSDPVSRVTQ